VRQIVLSFGARRRRRWLMYARRALDMVKQAIATFPFTGS
jgi:hypothetical protein